MIEIKQLHHVSIVVEDVNRAKQFYRDVLGMKEVPWVDHYDFEGGWLRAGGYEVHLIQANDSVQPPGDAAHRPHPKRNLTFARHFCFRVSDLAEAIKTLEAHNVPLAAGPRPRGDGADQLYIYDPDGHMIELVEIPWL